MIQLTDLDKGIILFFFLLVLAIGFAVSISNKKLGIEASLSSIFNLDDFLLEHEPIIYANLTTYGLLVEKYINEIFEDIQKYHHETNSIR